MEEALWQEEGEQGLEEVYPQAHEDEGDEEEDVENLKLLEPPHADSREWTEGPGSEVVVLFLSLLSSHHFLADSR